ncbi:MAG: serine--tRNA ligase, partial [Longimicrobiales bacterium]
MIDIKRVRSDPAAVVKGLIIRGDPEAQAKIDALVAADLKRREALSEVNELKALRNEVSKEIGEAKRQGEDAAEAVTRMREVGGQIEGLDAVVREANSQVEEALLWMPNTPDAKVPEGGEDANVLLREWG